MELGVAPADDLAKSIEDKVESIYLVGDSFKPRNIIDAIYEGFRAAISI